MQAILAQTPIQPFTNEQTRTNQKHKTKQNGQTHKNNRTKEEVKNSKRIQKIGKLGTTGTKLNRRGGRETETKGGSPSCSSMRKTHKNNQIQMKKRQLASYQQSNQRGTEKHPTTLETQ